MNILLTGGAGFIGSNLGDALIARNNNVVCLDNFDSFYDPKLKEKNISHLMEHPNFKLIRGDILDKKLLDSLFGNYSFDAVVHLAALAGVRPSIQNPIGYFRINVEGTIGLLERCHKFQVPKFVAASSSSVYGATSTPPFSETEIADRPVSPYAASKRSGELACYAFHNLFGLNITCLRYFTVYGPRQRPEMAIHKFTRRIDQGREIEMFGDGSSSRDYTFIRDIVSGTVAAIDNCKDFEVYNLGESEVITLKELITEIGVALGKKPIVKILPDQPGDVPTTFADISKARTKLGYTPTTTLKEGLREFIEWFRAG